MRCVGYWTKGFFWIGPAPYHRDWDCWSNGQLWSCVGLLASVPISIFGTGVFAGWFLYA